MRVLRSAASLRHSGFIIAVLADAVVRVASFGRWTIDEGAQTVTRHRTGSINPDFDVPSVRTSLVRETVGRIPVGSGARLTWQRVE